MKRLHAATFQYRIITKVNVFSFPEGSSNPTDTSVTCFCVLSVLNYPAESDNWRTNQHQLQRRFFWYKNLTLKNPSLKYLSVRMLTVHQICIKGPNVSYILIHIYSTRLVLQRWVPDLTVSPFHRIHHHLTKGRVKGKTNSILEQLSNPWILPHSSSLTHLFLFYYLISNQTDNSINKCYVLRVGVKHTPNSQWAEMLVDGIKSSLQ